MTLEDAAVRMGISPDDFVAFCERWGIVEASLFGSILRDDFAPESDIDLLITYAESTDWNLLDLIQAKQELEELAGRQVDLVKRVLIEESTNRYRRESILSTAEPFYDSR